MVCSRQRAHVLHASRHVLLCEEHMIESSMQNIWYLQAFLYYTVIYM